MATNFCENNFECSDSDTLSTSTNGSSSPSLSGLSFAGRMVAGESGKFHDFSTYTTDDFLSTDGLELQNNSYLPNGNQEQLYAADGIKGLNFEVFPPSPEAVRSDNIFANEYLQKQKPRRRARSAYTTVQLVQLEKEFLLTNYLCRQKKIQISQSLGLSERQVKIWFQNRRMKLKKELKANSDSNSLQSELLRQKSSTLKSENADIVNRLLNHSVIAQNRQNFVENFHDKTTNTGLNTYNINSPASNAATFALDNYNSPNNHWQGIRTLLEQNAITNTQDLYQPQLVNPWKVESGNSYYHDSCENGGTYKCENMSNNIETNFSNAHYANSFSDMSLTEYI